MKTKSPPFTPQSFFGGDKVFQKQGTKHNFKDVSEGKDGKVLLILCNLIGIGMGRASEKGTPKEDM